MKKYIPHAIALATLAFALYSQTWVSFASFLALLAFVVYSELKVMLEYKNDVDARFERLNSDIRILNDRTLSMQTGLSQVRLTKGLK